MLVLVSLCVKTAVLQSARAEVSPLSLPPPPPPQLHPKPPPPPHPKPSRTTLFAIVSRARSGTTWLLSMLNSHPHIRCKSEILLRKNASEARRTILPEWQQWAAGQPCKTRRPAPPSLKTARCARGFKWFNGEAFDVTRDSENAHWYLEFLSKIKLILLERQGLDHVVSQIKHQNTALFQCKTAECASNISASQVAIHGPIAQMLDERVAKFTAELSVLRNTMRWGQYLYLTYDELMTHPGLCMQRIFDFLGVAPWAAKTNATLKMGAERVYDGIANADEVRAKLAGTRWEVR
mmetsp:Transcript_29962/g.100143  ORF Transcript_29962/g.100143 Transcript_29962/m.100143 type:complete len:293 (+) Transcript_29962:205-1083(+)